MGDQRGKLRGYFKFYFSEIVTGEFLFTMAASKRIDSPGRRAYRMGLQWPIYTVLYL